MDVKKYRYGNRALDAAYRKGRSARKAGKTLLANPYHGLSGFSRAFQRCWTEGWIEEMRKVDRVRKTTEVEPEGGYVHFKPVRCDAFACGIAYDTEMKFAYTSNLVTCPKCLDELNLIEPP